MSEVWSQGYFTDVGYTYGYYRETSPVYQRFCLLLRGLASTDLDDASAHCELGFGQGVSVAINSAANPGRYVATDFNPAHAAHARDLTSHSGRDLRIYDDSFEQLLARDDLPEFDSISLHGIWSWISRDNQNVIAKFAARRLRPGGVFYISYNCFPGWAPAHPLRQVLSVHDRYKSASAAPSRRIDDALKFSRELLAANPMFARATAGLDERLKMISGQNRDYLAHEYFNRDWNCVYFTDVADALEEAKLEFATTAEPLDLVDAINLTAEGIAFLDGIEHPMLREQIRDYFVNKQFRKDLYQRGIRRLSAAASRERTLATRIVLERPVAEIPMIVNTGQGDAALHEDTFRPLLAELAARDHAPKSFGDLLRALPAFSLDQITMAVAVLVGAGHASPCHAEAMVAQVRERSRELNRHLLDRARTHDDVNHLASPVTGAGVSIGRIEQLFLLARTGGCDAPAEWARFVWRLLDDQGRKVVKAAQQLETPEANVAELTEQAETFKDRLPILRALEIV